MSQSPSHTLQKAALIALMAFGSIMLWLGIPVGWLWLGSVWQTNSDGTGFGPYLLVIVGIIVSVIAMARLLARLNHIYGQVDGEEPVVRVRMPWHRSMRGEDDGRAPRQVLDVVMVISVSLALIAFGLWFVLAAGSPLPSS